MVFCSAEHTMFPNKSSSLHQPHLLYEDEKNRMKKDGDEAFILNMHQRFVGTRLFIFSLILNSLLKTLHGVYCVCMRMCWRERQWWAFVAFSSKTHFIHYQSQWIFFGEKEEDLRKKLVGAFLLFPLPCSSSHVQRYTCICKQLGFVILYMSTR